jgi:RNA polymerase sigma factor (sigma-70 family)
MEMKSHETKPDMALWQAYKKGDFLSFSVLFDRYKNAIFNLSLRSVNSETLADAILQKVILRLHLSRHLVDTNHPLKHWIFVITKSEINRVQFDSPLVSFSHGNSEPEVFKKAFDEKNEFKDQLNEVYSKLSERQKELLEIKYIDGLAFEEISEKLGVNRNE